MSSQPDEVRNLYLKRDLFAPRETEEEEPLAKLVRSSMNHPHSSNGYGREIVSPVPRRKQARPRRRSGDSVTTTPPSAELFKSLLMSSSTPSPPVQDAPEDLSVKKPSCSSPTLQVLGKDSYLSLAR